MDGRIYKYETIRRLREDRKLTQPQVADLVGSSHKNSIYEVESGKMCSIKLLMRLAKLYGVGYKTLLRSEKQIEEYDARQARKT